MASTSSDPESFALPKLRTVTRGGPGVYWDIKFYPYLTARDDPAIFAVVGSFIIHIYEATNEDSSGLRLLATFMKENQEPEPDNYAINCLSWCSLDSEDSAPLLATAGDNGHIQIIDAFSGDLKYTLSGHGYGTVNDLVTHPKFPWIIASASMDGSVRIWDLRRAGKTSQSTCVIICGHNLAHEAGLLTVDWHNSGRYIVSGGFDHKICVWTLPDLSPDSTFWHEISKEGRQRSSEETRVIHYPHFITSAIHSDYVDKVIFWGDLLISKAAGNAGKENRVVLWGITGFHSSRPPPSIDTAPKAQEHLETRNGFIRNPRVALDDDTFDSIDVRFREVQPYTRYLEFQNPFSLAFYVRFGMLEPSPLFPELHPILTVGNTYSHIRHWDLERFVVGHDGREAPIDQAGNKSVIAKKGIARRTFKTTGTAQSPAEDETITNSSRTSSTVPTTPDAREPSTEATSRSSIPLSANMGDGIKHDRRKYPIHDANTSLKEHMKNEVSDMKTEKKWFTTRAVGWSLCGKWCVVVGESEGSAAMILLDRWTRADAAPSQEKISIA